MCHTSLKNQTDPNPSSTNPWNTRYICDSKGTFTGVPGQWYELPQETNIGYGPSTGESNLKELLSREGVKKVNLTNGKFEAGKVAFGKVAPVFSLLRIFSPGLILFGTQLTAVTLVLLLHKFSYVQKRPLIQACCKGPLL